MGEWGPRSAAPAGTKVEDLFNRAFLFLPFGDNCFGQSKLTQSRDGEELGSQPAAPSPHQLATPTK